MLAFVLTLAQVNTEEEARDRRQTIEQCQQRIINNQNSISNAIVQIGTSCVGTTCNSDCMSALNTIKNDIGCCLEKYSGNTAGVDAAYQQCGISPPGRCNSAFGIFTSFSAITLVSVVCYLLN